MDIKGTCILVTGAASGMGQAIAHHLSQQGAQLGLLDQNEAQLKTIAEQVKGLSLVADVCDPDAVQKAIAQLSQKFGYPRVCINCAGIIRAGRLVGKNGPFELETFTEVMNVNVVGTFNVMRLVAKDLIEQPLVNEEERGVIINLASIAAFEGQIGQVAYSASKGAVAAMTLPVARELAQFGVRAVTLAPGLINTPMLQNLPDKVQEALEASTVFPKRLGESSEIASLVAEVVRNPLLNGEVIRIDGGVRLRA